MAGYKPDIFLKTEAYLAAIRMRTMAKDDSINKKREQQQEEDDDSDDNEEEVSFIVNLNF